jgi:class 3 adenylate cyclase
MAARLAGQAGPGEIVVSPEVADLAGSGGFRFEQIEAARLKGFDEPVRLFRLQPAEHG